MPKCAAGFNVRILINAPSDPVERVKAYGKLENGIIQAIKRQIDEVGLHDSELLEVTSVMVNERVIYSS